MGVCLSVCLSVIVCHCLSLCLSVCLSCTFFWFSMAFLYSRFTYSFTLFFIWDFVLLLNIRSGIPISLPNSLHSCTSPSVLVIILGLRANLCLGLRFLLPGYSILMLVLRSMSLVVKLP